MRRVLLCVLIASMAVGAASCGSDKKSSEAQTRTVHVDGSTDKFNGAFLLYFPKQVTVRPGDTVDFAETWTGEPHTVTMGTLVDSAIKDIDAIPPDQRQNAQPPASYAKLPSLLPPDGDFNQNAAQPCFLPTGDPPPD